MVSSDSGSSDSVPDSDIEAVSPAFEVRAEESDSEQGSAFPWLIRVVSGMIALLSIAVLLIWIWASMNGITLGGPPPTLTGWEESYRDLTGLDEVTGLDGSGVLVCIVDSGIELGHPDLDHLILAGWLDVIDNRTEPYDDEGHGTAMAGIIVARDGLRGNAQGVDLLVAKAIDEMGAGTDSSIAEAVDWCVEEQADIISLSLGGEQGFSFAGFSSDELEDSVQDALDEGVFVIAAAGNDGQDDDGDVSSPGSLEDVICVGGVTRQGNLWSGSSEGDNNGRLWPNPMLPRSDPDQKPELIAPAAEVPVLIAGGSGDGAWWGSASGTSAATAWVSGALALLLEEHPELQREGSEGGLSAIERVKELISENSQVDQGQTEHDDHFGYGILRIDLLLGSLSDSSSDDEESENSAISKLGHGTSNELQVERRKTPMVPPLISTKAAESSSSTERTNSIQRLKEATSR